MTEKPLFQSQIPVVKIYTAIFKCRRSLVLLVSGIEGFYCVYIKDSFCHLEHQTVLYLYMVSMNPYNYYCPVLGTSGFRFAGCQK